MANSKTYLNVPFAQKDAAKALGAKWDPANKKWYAPANIDITLLAKWNSDASSTSPKAISKPKARATASKDITLGVTTYAQDSNFVAYDGNKPPWN
ncbi:MAG: hypothetical protein GQ581_05390 [Methyloprofundus sp.]|nr:hypothetical protein [Methyloprofundus sp.]